jgi:hypothetical protein
VKRRIRDSSPRSPPWWRSPFPAAAAAAAVDQGDAQTLKMQLKADSNEVAVEGVIAPAKPPRLMDADAVI